MAEPTQILNEKDRRGRHVSHSLLPLVYEQLRQLAEKRLASERADHTLQATALVHEAYLRLEGSTDVAVWETRGHFFAAAAEAMRRILIESARAKNAKKRGGDLVRVELGDFVCLSDESPELLLDIDAGLNELEREDREAAELVKLRLFAGMSVTEAGETLGMSRSSAYENWEFAKSWFAVYLSPFRAGG
ncbi:MAG: ECF-type sigma factor [bacterium]|nr:ECF-type sigma factor [bacterium]